MGRSVKEGRQNVGLGPEGKKRRGFHKTTGRRRAGETGISGERQRGQGTSPIVMMVLLRNAPACVPGVFIEPLVASSLQIPHGWKTPANAAV